MTHATVLPVDDFSTCLSLLDEAKGKQQIAWLRLVELYEPLVKCWCRREGLTEADAEDVRQEVLTAVWRHLDTFDRKKSGSFRCWLKTITRSKASDLRRRRERQAAEGGSEAHARLAQLPAPEGEGQACVDEAGVLYRRALELIKKDFAESTWRAFWGVVIEARRSADVAAELGMTRNAVFQARARVLHRLREEFTDFLEE